MQDSLEGYEWMANIQLEPDHIGRKVRPSSDRAHRDGFTGDGKIIGYDNSGGTGIVIVEVVLGKEPRRFRKNELWMKEEPALLTKTMKFSGKKFGALETFIKQAKLEGAKADTVLNPKDTHWVGITIELPLATEPEDGVKSDPEKKEPEW